MLINFNGSCQATPGAPTTTRHIHPYARICVSESCDLFFLFFKPQKQFGKCLSWPDGHEHERFDFLRGNQPFNASGPTDLRHRGNLQATFKQRARAKHSCGEAEPKTVERRADPLVQQKRGT